MKTYAALLVIVIAMLMVSCSASDKAMNDLSSKMEQRIVKCGDTLYYNASTNKDNVRFYKFRGNIITTQHDRQLSEADKSNGIQYSAYISMSIGKGIVYNYKDKRWVDINDVQLMIGDLERQNGKINSNIMDTYTLFGEKLDDDYRILACKDFELSEKE